MLSQLVLFVCCLSQMVLGASPLMNRPFRIQQRKGQSKSLSTSAVGEYLQQQKLAVRICQIERAPGSEAAVLQKEVTTGCRIQYHKPGKPRTAGAVICPHEDVCTTSMSAVTAIRTTSGAVHDVTSAVNCTCIPRDSSCRRRRMMHLYFKGTKFEKRIDVGKCVGRCQGSRNLHCRPVATRTSTVRGPNGHMCVEVIQSCACVNSCYRMSHKETHQVLEFDARQNSTAFKTRVIDIGRCVGTCSGHVKGTCLYREHSNSERSSNEGSSRKRCLVRTPSRAVKCRTKTRKSYAFRTIQGERKSLDIIETCECS